MLEQHKELAEMYGHNAAEWLKRWDANETVWSVEMGGLGPGYEQAIQITTAEILRYMIEQNLDHTQWSDQDKWIADRTEIEKWSFQTEKIKGLGLSGSQWSASLNLATNLYARDPWVALSDSAIAERLIQVQREMPQ